MNPTAHSDDTADYSNLHHIKRMSPEDPKTINNPCSISCRYAEQREAQEAEFDEAAINRPNYERPKKPNPRRLQKICQTTRGPRSRIR